MDPKEGDKVHCLRTGVAARGTVVKRVGTRIRIDFDNGGGMSWVEIKELISCEETPGQASRPAAGADVLLQTHEETRGSPEDQGERLPVGFFQMNILERQAAMAEQMGSQMRSAQQIPYMMLKRYLPKAGVPSGLVESTNSRDELLRLAAAHQVDLTALEAEAATTAAARQAAEAKKAQEAADGRAQQLETERRLRDAQEERVRALFAIYSPALLNRYVAQNIAALCRDDIFSAGGAADGDHLRISADDSFTCESMERGMVYAVESLSREQAVVRASSALRLALEAYPSKDSERMFDVRRVDEIVDALVQAGRVDEVLPPRAEELTPILPRAKGGPVYAWRQGGALVPPLEAWLRVLDLDSPSRLFELARTPLSLGLPILLIESMHGLQEGEAVIKVLLLPAGQVPSAFYAAGGEAWVRTPLGGGSLRYSRSCDVQALDAAATTSAPIDSPDCSTAHRDR